MEAFLGIDVGSLSCDGVLVDARGEMLAASVVPTGARNLEAIERVRGEVMQTAGLDDAVIRATVSTGYGRNRVEQRLAAVTEITCHAHGIQALFPETDILIDIGGQDSKAIRLDRRGGVQDFAMNDKCAAGTGRFLEAMARALQVDITELGDLDRGARENLTLSSMCTVFAESEVVSLIASGTQTREIVAGLNRAIASRTASLVKRVGGGLEGFNLAMSGGVARNAGVVRAIAEVLGQSLTVPANPDTVGAFGAALIARQRFQDAASD
jgi:predicted CoA-substrate-specific enzyme activase